LDGYPPVMGALLKSQVACPLSAIVVCIRDFGVGGYNVHTSTSVARVDKGYKLGMFAGDVKSWLVQPARGTRVRKM
jgi:hypothetical protein